MLPPPAEHRKAMAPTVHVNATERLMAADAQAARATRRLRLLQARALAGAPYDPDDFDAAILAQRLAQTEAADARLAWVRMRRARPSRRIRTNAA